MTAKKNEVVVRVFRAKVPRGAISQRNAVEELRRKAEAFVLSNNKDALIRADEVQEEMFSTSLHGRADKYYIVRIYEDISELLRQTGRCDR